MTRTPAPALSPAEAAPVAAFDAAPTPPDCDPEQVETVARVIYNADPDVSGAWPDASDYLHDLYRRLAAAAIAAMPPSPAEEAVKRVEALAEELTEQAEFLKVDAGRASARGEHTYVTFWLGKSDAYSGTAARLRAALASPAPAPQGGGQR